MGVKMAVMKVRTPESGPRNQVIKSPAELAVSLGSVSSVWLNNALLKLGFMF